MGDPYYGPGWVPVRECETRKGLNHFLKAMYLVIIIMAVSGLLLGFVYSSITGFNDIEDETDVTEMIGPLILMGISALIIVIAGIAAFIFGILGLVGLHKGKAEFGPAHEGSVKLGIMFLVLAIVISVISGVVGAALLFGTIDSMGPNSGDIFSVQDSVNSISLVTGIIGIVSAVFQYLFLVYLVKELTTPDRKNMLWAGFGIGVSSSIVSLIVVSAILNGWGLTGSSDLVLALYTSLIPSILTLIALILFVICFRAVLARIDSGELKPILPQTPFYSGYMPPPPPPQLRLCTGCGQQIQANYNNCPHCGKQMI